MSEPLAWALPEDLAELLREDPETLQSILHTFVEQTRLNLDRVAEFVETGTPEELSRAVHRLKGGLAQMGANHAADLCRAFELALPDESRKQWKSTYTQLRTASETVLLLAEKMLTEL